MARDWYTPDELRDLEALDPCPYWQRMNVNGWCVERWWSGGLVSSVISGVATAVGMAVLGSVLVYAAKSKVLSPALAFFKKSREQAKMLENRRGRRSRRRRRRRR